jgi:phosphoribosyl 1,2-cyclic phosphodiesterase
MSEFSFTFHGVRGSVACAHASHLKYGGNTACIEVRAGAQTIILDAGNGLRLLGKTMMMDERWKKPINLLLSHTHFDHINGFPFFAPTYQAGATITVWAGHLQPTRTLEEVMRLVMASPHYPVTPDIFKANLKWRDFTAGSSFALNESVAVRTAPLNHPDGATGYRLEYKGKSLCYVTDTEHTPGRLDPAILALIEGTDAFIYDSTYTDAEYPNHIGWGHSTWQEAMRLGKAAGVGEVFIFHHDPNHDDAFLDGVAAEVALCQQRGRLAREGETIQLIPS